LKALEQKQVRSARDIKRIRDPQARLNAHLEILGEALRKRFPQVLWENIFCIQTIIERAATNYTGAIPAETDMVSLEKIQEILTWENLVTAVEQLLAENCLILREEGIEEVKTRERDEAAQKRAEARREDQELVDWWNSLTPLQMKDVLKRNPKKLTEVDAAGERLRENQY
jgi:hypothetical protein